MKKLPIGIPSITEIINKNYIYVDKTSLIYSLITEGKYYFLSRPRRFGKSLLINTLKEILKGNKDLFQGCAIYSSDYSWDKHPVIHLDFSEVASLDLEEIEDDLKETFHEIAASYGKTVNIPSARRGLRNLVKALSEINPVAVLVDEYDKPIVDNTTNIERAKKNREFLRLLFTPLKALNDELKLIFIAGVSRFAQVSLFSGLNNAEDITMESAYATLLGYTEEEIQHYFREYLEFLSQTQNKNKEQLFSEMRLWYNGYRFSEEPVTVYNPHSTMRFLKKGKTATHWFATATPSFLVDWIRENSFPVEDFSGMQERESVVPNHQIETLDIVSLMWQTGYLTIRDYNPVRSKYILDYPNLEVKKAFLENLIEGMTNLPGKVPRYLDKLIESLAEKDLITFFENLKTIFSGVPYTIHLKKEQYYQSLFFVITQLIGLAPEAEEATNIGRIDTVIKTDKFIYIIEFKVDSSAEEALNQIKQKNYFQKYRGEERKIILVGVSFNSEERNISDWKHEEAIGAQHAPLPASDN